MPRRPKPGPSTISSIRPFLSASEAEIGSPPTIILTASSGPDRARQALRAAGARQQAELHLGQAQPRFLDRDAEMTGERDLEAAAERRAVDRGHDRLRRVLHQGQHLDQAGRLRRLAEFGDVGAGDEGAAAAGQHDTLDLGIGDRGLHAFQNAAADRGAQCVDGGTVDGDDADAVVTFELDHFVHATLLGCLFFVACRLALRRRAACVYRLRLRPISHCETKFHILTARVILKHVRCQRAQSARRA